MTEVDYVAVSEYVEAALDLEYVTVTGYAVAAALADGIPVEANYQPGDGSRYGLIFVPLWRTRTAPGRVAPIRGLGPEPVAWDSHAVVGAVPEPDGSYPYGMTLIATEAGYAQALDLSRGRVWHPSYVVGKWAASYASACAVALLLTEVAGAMP